MDDHGTSSRCCVLVRKSELADLHSNSVAVLVYNSRELDRIPRAPSSIPVLYFFRGLLPEHFVLSASGDRCAISQADELVELSYPICGIAAVIGPPDILGQLASWWAESGEDALPANIATTEPASSDVDWESVAEAIGTLLQNERTQQTANLGAIFELRRENEQLRQAVDAMGMALSASTLPKPVLKCETPPSSRELILDAGTVSDSLSQVITEAAATGISGIEVNITSASGNGRNDAFLRVALTTVESGYEVGAWAVPISQLKKGWLVLELPRPLGELLETPSLELSLVGEAGNQVRFAAAARRPAANTGRADADDTGSGIALRVNTASAGRFIWPDYWLWEHGNRIAREKLFFTLPDEKWEQAQSLDSQGQVSVNAQRGLYAFGPQQGVVSVRLPGLRAPALSRLLANVKLVGSKSGCTEVAALIIGSEVKDARVGEYLSRGAYLAFSQWKTLSQVMPEITLGLVIPPNLGCDLVLAARTAEAEAHRSVTDFPWVQWDTIKIGMVDSPHLDHDRLNVSSLTARPANMGDGGLVPGTVPFCLPQRVSITKEEMFGETYRHIVVDLHNLNFENRHWKLFTFKLQDFGGTSGLEFRAIEGVAPFEKWPPAESDRFGPFLNFREDMDSGGLIAALSALSSTDRRFLRDLAARLSGWLATTELPAEKGSSDIAYWLTAARRMNERLEKIADLSAVPGTAMRVA